MRSHILTILFCSSLLIAQSASDDKIYEPGKDGVTRPVAIFMPEPDIPEKLRKQGRKKNGPKHWRVVIGGNVDSDGHYRQLSVKESAGKEADEAALSKVKTWTFQPCRKDDKPVKCSLDIEVAFDLY
jgi:TonB family protein